MNKKLLEKEIYAYRRHCIHYYNGQRIRALYWKYMYKYYQKKQKS